MGAERVKNIYIFFRFGRNFRKSRRKGENKKRITTRSKSRVKYGRSTMSTFQQVSWGNKVNSEQKEEWKTRAKYG